MKTFKRILGWFIIVAIVAGFELFFAYLLGWGFFAWMVFPIATLAYAALYGIVFLAINLITE